jgi:hypothetical protein
MVVVEPKIRSFAELPQLLKDCPRRTCHQIHIRHAFECCKKPLRELEIANNSCLTHSSGWLRQSIYSAHLKIAAPGIQTVGGATAYHIQE